MNKFWCRHIVWHLGDWAFEFGIVDDNGFKKIFTRLDDWDICPVRDCRAPRPNKTLAEKLYEAFPTKHPHMDIFKHLAVVAEEHFKENKI